MKVVLFTILTLLCLFQVASAKSTAMNHDLELLTNPETSLIESETNTTEISPLIDAELGLPVMRDQLTITESSEGFSLDLEDIDSTYGKMMQDFAAEQKIVCKLV